MCVCSPPAQGSVFHSLLGIELMVGCHMIMMIEYIYIYNR